MNELLKHAKAIAENQQRLQQLEADITAKVLAEGYHVVDACQSTPIVRDVHTGELLRTNWEGLDDWPDDWYHIDGIGNRAFDIHQDYFTTEEARAADLPEGLLEYMEGDGLEETLEWVMESEIAGEVDRS